MAQNSKRTDRRFPVAAVLAALVVLASVTAIRALPSKASAASSPAEQSGETSQTSAPAQSGGETSGAASSGADVSAAESPADASASSGAASSAPAAQAPQTKTDAASASQTKTDASAPQTPQPAAAPVDDTYFDDAVFVGDSRTEGLHLYSGLQHGQYLYAVGATVASVFDKATEKTSGGKVPILDALAKKKFSKVYIMLGVNELGWPRISDYYEQYGKLVDRVREINPDAAVVLQSLPPVSAQQEAKHSYVNNERIAQFNQQIQALAKEKNCTYLDVASVTTGADGCLPPDFSADGVHMTKKGYQAWRTYLEEHPA
jgi:lysophospholipase L1-like esterase